MGCNCEGGLYKIGDQFLAQMIGASQGKTDSPVFKLYFLEEKRLI